MQLFVLHGCAAAEAQSRRLMLKGALGPAEYICPVGGTEGSHCGVVGAQEPESKAALQVLEIAALNWGARCVWRELRCPHEVERALT